MDKEQEGQAASEADVINDFTKASGAVETERKEAAASDIDTSADVKKAAPKKAAAKTPEGEEAPEEESLEIKDDSAAAEEPEWSEEDAEILENVDVEVLECLRTSFGNDTDVAAVLRMSPELANEIRAELDAEEVPQKAEEPKQPPVKEEKQGPDPLDAVLARLNKNVHGEEIVDALKAIADRQKQSQGEISKGRKELDEERQATFYARIDSILDGYGRGYKELGHSSTIRPDSREARLRGDVYAVASALSQRRNVPVERMLGRAVELFRNQGGKKAATQELIHKINAQDKRSINRPTRRISQQQGARKFANDYEEAEVLMTEAEEKAGLTT